MDNKRNYMRALDVADSKDVEANPVKAMRLTKNKNQ
jgi:hypothetical protein